MESTDSSTTASQHPQLPPGFRFHPTDEELVVHYLKRKADSVPLPVAIIAEVDLYKFDPWELPAKAAFGEQEWYFFSPRDRKYPNGARPNRAATSGYWKATGTDKPVLTSGAGGGTHKVGVKKALVFYGGKPPKGVKTNWIMHEYRITDNTNPPASHLANKKASLRLDDWVLCRIYKKNNTQQRPMEHESMNDDVLASIPVPVGQQNPTVKPSTYASLLQNQHNMFDGLTTDDHAITNASNLCHHQLASSSSKRTLFWNDEGIAGSSSSTKRFLADHNDNVARTDDNSSIATLLGEQAMMGSLGHGVPYHLPNINWYS